MSRLLDHETNSFTTLLHYVVTDVETFEAYTKSALTLCFSGQNIWTKAHYRLDI